MEPHDALHRLLEEIDAHVAELALDEPLDLYLAGGAALALFYERLLTTEDIDVLERGADVVLRPLEARFGEGTDRARQIGAYLQVLNDAIPPMLEGYRKRATVAEGPWRAIRVWKLDPYDLLLSKLKRFSARDRSDIRLLCDDPDVGIEADELDRLWQNYWWDSPDRKEQITPHFERVMAYLRGDAHEL